MNNEPSFASYINERANEFRPNPQLDKLISTLQLLLEPIQINQNELFFSPKYPVVSIVGSSRSGTTLCTQILAASKAFAYPTNFLSRFAYAPLIGALIQQMIFNPAFDFRGELSDIKSTVNFNSILGKTNGALGVSEFFHFWRKFFPNNEPCHINPEDLMLVKIDQLRKELASIESVFDKPFMSKNKMIQYNIEFFSKMMPEFFIIYIKRNPLFVMQSILQSRRKYYGRDDIWWSVKPKEYKWLCKLKPYHQIAGQVFFTEKAIDEQLITVEDGSKIVCYYENFCSNPEYLYEQLRISFKNIGYKLNEYKPKHSFECSNSIRLDKDEIYQLEKAYHEIASGLVCGSD